MSVNKVILIGNLGKDPEVRYTANGRAVARFPIATSEVWNDAEGNWQERTEWHNIIVWGKQGETCGQKLYVTEIIAQRVRFLGGGGGGRVAPEADTDTHGETAAASGGQAPFDDDIPF